MTLRFAPDHIPHALIPMADLPSMLAHYCAETGVWVSLLDVFDILDCRCRIEARKALRDSTLTFSTVHRSDQRRSPYEVVPSEALQDIREMLTPTQNDRLNAIINSASDLQTEIEEGWA